MQPQWALARAGWHGHLAPGTQEYMQPEASQHPANTPLPVKPFGTVLFSSLFHQGAQKVLTLALSHEAAIWPRADSQYLETSRGREVMRGLQSRSALGVQNHTERLEFQQAPTSPKDLGHPQTGPSFHRALLSLASWRELSSC